VKGRVADWKPTGRGRVPLPVSAVLLILALGVGMLAGCGEAKELPTVKFVTMEYTARTSTDWKDLEKRFNQKHDEFKVSVETVAWGDARTKLEKDLQDQETAPDLATLPASWVLEFHAQGLLQPLDGLADDTFLSRFHPATLNTGKVDGRRYGLPYGLSVRFLYANRKAKEALTEGNEGLPLATWDELAEAARTTQALTDQQREANGLPAQFYGWGVPLSPDEAPTTFAYFLWTAGGRFFDDAGNVAFNSEQGKRALAFLAGVVSSGQATQPNPTTYNLNKVEALFRTEKLGLLITGHWLRPALITQRVRADMLPLPGPPGGQSTTMASCDYLVMFVPPQGKEQDRQQVWEFVKFVYSPESRKVFLDRNAESMIPELSALLEDMPDRPVWTKVRAALGTAHFLPLNPDWPAVSNALAKEIIAACAGEKAPDTALADAAKAAQEAIDKRRAGETP